MMRRRMLAAAGITDDVAKFIAVAHSAFDATSLPLTTSDPVSTWGNLGTTGGDATSTSTARPTYIASGVNSQPVVRFDGSNDSMNTPAWTSLSQPNTIIAVAKFDNPDTTGRQLIDGLGAGKRHAFYTSAGEWKLLAGTVLVDGANDANWHVFVFKFDTTTSAFYVDGGSPDVSGNAGSDPLTGLYLGSNYLSEALWDGDIHFVGLYDGDLITDNLPQLNATCQALADRVGTTWTDIT